MASTRSRPPTPRSTTELAPPSGASLQRGAGLVVAMTGASSFVGQNLLGLLEEDPRIGRVVVIDVKPPPPSNKKTRFYEVDLTQPTAEARLSELLAAERVETVLHLAFLSSPSRAAAYAHELESVGTMHLLVAARQARVRKLIMSSLTMLYGAHPTNPNFLGEHHPLRASKREAFFADKIAAEAEALRFAERSEGAIVTILRTAPILGPTVKSFLTRYLSRRVVPTMLGFDPLLQFVHEVDAIAAFKLAVDREVPGTFNIVGDGVLPLSTVIKLAGRVAFPIPHPLAEPLTALGWLAQLVPAPPTFLPLLRFLCVADGARARDVMGFRPAYTTREALVDFVSAQRLRDVKLLQEA